MRNKYSIKRKTIEDQKKPKDKVKQKIIKKKDKITTPTSKNINWSPFSRFKVKGGSQLNKFIIVTPKSKLTKKEIQNEEVQKRLSQTESHELTEVKVVDK